jgi:hypothetical protein
MVGNDVVDLSDRDADPATLHPRFDARVFSARELELLRASSRPVALRWRLWAAKEAAYKAVSKAYPGFVFSPSHFRVALAPSVGAGRFATGAVRCSAGRCRVALAESDRAIHAVARFDQPGNGEASESAGGANVDQPPRRRRTPESGDPPRRPRSTRATRARLLQGQLRVDSLEATREDPHAASRAVRDFARTRLAAFLGVDEGDLEIRRRGRIPELWLAGRRAHADLSLSHHGAVIAFACEVLGRGASAPIAGRSI